MAIERIEIFDFSPPFRDGPYAMSHVTANGIFGRILRIRLGDGRMGHGEVVFTPSMPSKERARRICDEDWFMQSLVGSPVDRLLAAASEARSRDRSWHGVAFALETAWLDIEGKQANQPAHALLGGAVQTAVADYFSISERETTAIRQRFDIAGVQCKVLQLKLGTRSLDHDVLQLLEMLKLMSAEQVVQADANGGWTVEQACDIIERFDDNRVIWEEPCMTYGENVKVARMTGGHIMVDQCVGTRELAIHAIDEGIAGSICIKPATLGGLTVARDVRDHAIRAGTRARIDGPWCGDIAAAAVLHLAVGMPEDLLMSGCDLREPVAIPVEMQGVCRDADGRIYPPPGAGLGVRVPDSALGSPQKTFD